MAETLPGHSFILKQTATFNRPFFFGTTGQAGTMTVLLSKNAGAWAANSGGAGAITELSAGTGGASGWYNVALSNTDTNASGILAYHVSAGSGGPADFADIIEPQVFRDLQMVGGTGNLPVAVSSNLKQNQPFTALFFMTQAGTTNPAPGLTVTGQRTFTAVGGFANVAGAIAEVGGVNAGGGWYAFSGLSADSNSPQAGYKMSAPGANDSDFSLWFQP
jgi:hypothetical protein